MCVARAQSNLGPDLEDPITEAENTDVLTHLDLGWTEPAHSSRESSSGTEFDGSFEAAGLVDCQCEPVELAVACDHGCRATTRSNHTLRSSPSAARKRESISTWRRVPPLPATDWRDSSLKMLSALRSIPDLGS